MTLFVSDRPHAHPAFGSTGPVRTIVKAEPAYYYAIGHNLTLECGHVIWRRCYRLNLPKRTHCPLCEVATA